MNEDVRMSMILCMSLEPAEQAKVERLDGPIANVFIEVGRVVRLCQGRNQGNQRFLDFSGMAGVEASVDAAAFVTADDGQAVAMVSRALA
jgi:hypothetical protein